jgi:hypothetical protein
LCIGLPHTPLLPARKDKNASVSPTACEKRGIAREAAAAAFRPAEAADASRAGRPVVEGVAARGRPSAGAVSFNTTDCARALKRASPA